MRRMLLGASSIKRRISLLLDSSSSSPETGAIDQGSTPQPIAEPEAAPLGIKQRIKKLTEDGPPTPSPPAKPTVKPRSLPLDLTTRYGRHFLLAINSRLCPKSIPVMPGPALCNHYFLFPGLYLKGLQTIAAPPSVSQSIHSRLTKIPSRG